MRLSGKHYHFIGIGGIGMSALARIQLQRGCSVSGSDTHPSALTTQLKKLGAHIEFSHAPETIDRLVEQKPCIVVSSSIRADNPEVMRAERQNMQMQHRGDLLGELARAKKGLGVTGSHGKTSTSALLFHLLASLDPKTSFAIGGQLKATGTNSRWEGGEFFVLEIDESDGRSFHIPLVGGILTNISREHLEFWEHFPKLLRAFEKWAHTLSDSNLLLWCADDPLCRKVARGRGYSYGLSKAADFRVQNAKNRGSIMQFDLALPSGATWKELQISQIGRHQVLNSAGAIALAHLLGMDRASIQSALMTHLGVARRIEYRGDMGLFGQRVALFDDYAHHPKEVCATLQALRELCGAKTLIALFQPHRYSRLRECFEEFFTSFDAADAVFILPVYAAGEIPLAGIHSEGLTKGLQKHSRAICRLWQGELTQENLLAHFPDGGVLCTLGAGDITLLQRRWKLTI